LSLSVFCRLFGPEIENNRWTSSQSASVPADGNGNGVVNAADYVLWRNQLVDQGNAGAASPSAIPEPSSLVLPTMPFAAAGCWRGGRCRSIHH
jgi:hypothetical protein